MQRADGGAKANMVVDMDGGAGLHTVGGVNVTSRVGRSLSVVDTDRQLNVLPSRVGRTR